jgi:hypothetical protein
MTLTAEQRHALRLLADAGPRMLRSDHAGARLRDRIADMIRDGLATAEPERVRAGGRSFEVTRVRITEGGRRALAE